MNDKSSRSHSVFTLVMTQTKVRPLNLFGYICLIEERCYFYFNQPITNGYIHMMLFVCAQTEFVEEEEHDHYITSRINLVDLAGSERCNSAQTSGDRLRVIQHPIAVS